MHLLQITRTAGIHNRKSARKSSFKDRRKDFRAEPSHYRRAATEGYLGNQRKI
jgi:hypothetical protein